MLAHWFGVFTQQVLAHLGEVLAHCLLTLRQALKAQTATNKPKSVHVHT